LKQFENEFSQLEKKLQRNENITAEEKERRLRQLENLASKKLQLNSRFQNVVASSSRKQLFAASEKNEIYDNDESGDDSPIIDKNAPLETLSAEREQIIQQQDRSLETLSQAISRQKNIAIRIGNEVDSHNDILDNIGDQMDNTSARVSSTTRNVERFSERDSTLGYWMIILCLLGANIIVAII
jgi:syntaxin of plants SYP6